MNVHLLPGASSKSEPLESLLFTTVMGANHHVAVRWDVQSGWLHFVPTDPDLRFADQSRSSAGVMFLQVTYEGLPASTYAHHHMTLIQHLQRWHRTAQSRGEIKSAYIFWLCYWQAVYEFSIIWKDVLMRAPSCTHTSGAWAALAMKGKWSLKISLNQMKQHLMAPAEHTHRTNPHMKMHTHAHAVTHKGTPTQACNERHPLISTTFNKMTII